MNTSTILRVPRIVALGFSVCLPAMAGTKVLLDFGTDTSFRGASVSSPDSNGNHWNGINLGAFYSDLLDTTGAATTIDFGFDGSGNPVGTDSFNGPAGDTLDPAEVVIDSAALGDLGIKEAAFDWVSAAGGRFQIQGLDPARRYELTIFGSAKFQTDSTSVYRVFDDSAYSNEIASSSLELHDAASPWLHNQDMVAEMAGLVPSSSGVLYVEFEGSAGNSAKINALSIEDSPNAAIGAGAVLVDFGNDSSFRGVSVSGTDANGNTWNSIAPGSAWTDLTDAGGGATTLDVSFTTALATDSFNGPAGATSDPVTAGEIAATEIDADLLGVLGVPEAAIDFIGTPNDGDFVGIEIAGLEPGELYNLSFFSSRKFQSDTQTLIYVFDDDQLTTELGDVTVIHGINGNHNASVVVTLEDLEASATGTLYVEFEGAGGGKGFLNAMAIDPVSAADATPPVITLNGDDPAQVVWGSSYVDAGATGEDDVDGPVAVTTEGTVDTSILGSYTIDYSATDSAGNVGTASRTVNVVLPPDADVAGVDGLTPIEKYVFGAAGPDDPVEVPSLSIQSGDLVLTAVVRTNDPSLAVTGESSTDLTIWTDLVVDPGGTAAPDQGGVPAGAERREFVLPGGLPANFLRLAINLL